MRSNCDMTWYSRSLAGTVETYTRSVIYGVAWEDQRAENTSRGGAELAADNITVYIMDASGGDGLKEGDVIVNGIVTDNIGTPHEPDTGEDESNLVISVTALKAKYPGRVGRVRSVSHMNMGRLAMWHRQVGAV